MSNSRLHCPKCGAEASEEDAYCVECGNELTTEVAQPAQRAEEEKTAQVSTEESNATTPTETGKSTWAITSFVLGLCVILTFGLSGPFALWAGIRSNKQRENSGLATAGIVLGIIGSCVLALVVVALLLDAVGITEQAEPQADQTTSEAVANAHKLEESAGEPESEESSDTSGTSSTDTSEEPEESSGEPEYSPVTMAQFKQLEPGMTQEQVFEEIGPGEELSRNDIGGYTNVMYQWEGEGSFGANMNAMFQNGKLIQKSQFGLE